jgi:hypothetical protein
MTPFEEWLKQAKVTNDPEGDLVTDMRRDPDRPPTFTSLKALRSYVGFKSHYDTTVLASVPGAWRRYRAWCSRRYRPLSLSPCGLRPR